MLRYGKGGDAFAERCWEVNTIGRMTSLRCAAVVIRDSFGLRTGGERALDMVMLHAKFSGSCAQICVRQVWC